MNYIAHIPLAGGFCLGNLNVTKVPPVAITSYSNFESNDALLLRYLKKKGFDVPYYQLDKMTDDERQEMLKSLGKIDFVTGVPPCSGLSQAAQRKAGSRGTAEPNEWMYRSANFILNEIQPTVYAFENAPTLFTSAGDEVKNRLIDIGKTNGYSITFYKTNTLLHGIPQFRPRTFGIFYKGQYAPILNNYLRPYPNQVEYLNQIPSSASLQDAYMNEEWDITKFEIYKYLNEKYGKEWRKVLNDFKPHLTTYNYLQRINKLHDFQDWLETIPDASQTVKNNIAHIIKKTEMGKGSRINYRVLEIDKDYVYAVIGEMMGKQVHPTEDRLLNIREFLWLMCMPFDYEIENPRDYVKLSQNAPVKTCEDITTEMIAIINKERTLSTKTINMQDNIKYIDKKSKSLF
jgi:site-specific DNA-cytosine methylase